MSEDIDKATNTFINATLELESAIQQYQRAETKLGGSVNTICQKVDTINTHIDNVLKKCSNQLNVAVHASDEDMNAIQNLFNNEHKWILGKMQAHYREINSMFADELRVAQKRYKEYDGCYLGHYIQYFFWFSSLWASSFCRSCCFVDWWLQWMV